MFVAGLEGMRARNATYKYAELYDYEVRFSSRVEGDGIRIWRTE